MHMINVAMNSRVYLSTVLNFFGCGNVCFRGGAVEHKLDAFILLKAAWSGSCDQL